MVGKITSGLWDEAFAPRAKDAHAEPRARLLNALLQMRDKVADLVKAIPADCKDLTVHDETHLDALWEMASLITGPKYDLNPAEAFVLGGAILLHDAGLSTAAFPEGLSSIQNTEEWKDISSATLRQNGVIIDSDLVKNPPAHLLPEIKFAVLRTLHAAQAERMATEQYHLAGTGPIFLLEDTELRQAFGSAIGRIAHSHHWSIERVADQLNDNLGAGTVLPVDWSVSERKVACILRCADAAHIDRRRAPTMLFAAMRPTGVSSTHWNAQNKINKPTVDKTVLIYSAGQPFRIADAGAWWLAYDLVKIADAEIRSSNALLEEIHQPSFLVHRVAGAENPRALSKYLRPDGWRPVDAEIKVSDPAHLAATLGGRNLYGRDPLAPVRELLQNAADAVRGRRQLEDRPENWGSIRVTIEPNEDDDKSCWLHVDDNGIGMTERVMAGPLIDFGKSIWNSSILREEFPGLQGRDIEPIGRFGIGFFSVFELGNMVKVISRHYQSGHAEARTLEFQSISSRPVIRPAAPKELPQDFSTRISVQVKNHSRITSGYLDGQDDYVYRRARRPRSFAAAVLRLVSMLDIEVAMLDRITGNTFTHSGDIYGTKPSDFLDELLPELNNDEKRLIKEAHAQLIRPIVGEDGRKYGRAAISILRSRSTYENTETGAVHVGGFVYSDRGSIGVPIVGAIAGSTDSAARRMATSIAPEEALKRWATEQATLIPQDKFRSSLLLGVTESIITVGGNPGKLPYIFHSGGLASLSAFRAAIEQLSYVVVPLVAEYESRLSMTGYENLRTLFFELPLNESVFILRSGVDRLLDDDLTRSILKGNGREVTLSDIRSSTPFSTFVSVTTDVWGCAARFSIEPHQIFKTDMLPMPDRRWVLRLDRTKPASR